MVAVPIALDAGAERDERSRNRERERGRGRDEGGSCKSGCFPAVSKV